TSTSGTSWGCTSLSSALSASSTPATAPASKGFPSSTNSSTLSESACAVRDKSCRSPDCRPETVLCLLEEDSNGGAPLIRVFSWLVVLAFEVFLDCDFFTAFFLGLAVTACLPGDAFCARFGFANFDFVCLFLLFLFLEGMTAVYHRIWLADATGSKSRSPHAINVTLQEQYLAHFTRVPCRSLLPIYLSI